MRSTVTGSGHQAQTARVADPSRQNRSNPHGGQWCCTNWVVSMSLHGYCVSITCCWSKAIAKPTQTTNSWSKAMGREGDHVALEPFEGGDPRGCFRCSAWCLKSSRCMVLPLHRNAGQKSGVHLNLPPASSQILPERILEQRSAKTTVWGKIWPAFCFCIAFKLKMVFIFLIVKNSNNYILWHKKSVCNSDFSIHNRLSLEFSGACFLACCLPPHPLWWSQVVAAETLQPPKPEVVPVRSFTEEVSQTLL